MIDGWVVGCMIRWMAYSTFSIKSGKKEKQTKKQNNNRNLIMLWKAYDR